MEGQLELRSNIEFARFTENKKTTNLHHVADDSEVLETITREDIQCIDSIYIQPTDTTTYSAMGYSKVHKPRSNQEF